MLVFYDFLCTIYIERMPPKDTPKKPPPPVLRPAISESSLIFLPDDVIEGFQERIQTGIDWTHEALARRYHRAKCLQENIPTVPFSEGLQNRIKQSVLFGFLDENSPISIQDQWEIIYPITKWDLDRFANEEGLVCFDSVNCITDNVEKLLKKAVRDGDREQLKKELKEVTVLRILDSKITDLDSGLSEFTKLVTLNLCGNYIGDIDPTFLPPALKLLELQANRITQTESFAEHLPPTLLYLGLARNLLTDDNLQGLSRLPRAITTLDLSDNDIYHIDAVLDRLGTLPYLRSLSLAGNPCSVCMGYGAIIAAKLPNLQWLDSREILPTDRPVDPFEPHPDDYRSNYFNFTVLRIMSIPQPPKPDKGAITTFHVELELPLLDSKRRKFLMFRRNESLTEMLPPPEDEIDELIHITPSIAGPSRIDLEGESEDTDIYAHLEPKNPREIINYTILESNRVQWNKLVNFQEPTIRIFCPDLVALRDTFQSVVTLRLVYTVLMGKPGKPEKGKSKMSLKQPPGEFRVVLATVRCALKQPDWSQTFQHFHWDDSLGTNDAIHWGDGDLAALQYTLVAPKAAKGKETDTQPPKQTFPENLTCHFSFAIDTIRAVDNTNSRMTGHLGQPHERWGSQIEYLLSCLGYAVGIGNVWRFPYMCYKNGGGAFLVPYFLTLIICGIPLVYLETTLGQFASSGCISIFNISPLLKGAGYAAAVLNIVAIIYFSTILALPILYIYHSFSSPLPWEHCGNPWNTDKCVELTSNSSVFTSNGSITTPEDEFFHIRLMRVTPSINEIGGIVWPVFWCNLIGFVLVYLCICNGVRSVGKIVYFTVSFPYVVLCILFVRGITLPGAWQGILFYVWPDWQKLANPQVWADAAMQLFYSLGPGWGGLISMASFNRFNYNNLRSSIIIPLVNSGTSIWAGFVVFSVLGFTAERAGVPVGEVATAGPGLAFVTYPAAVTMMPASNFWAITFFIMLFFLGIDSMFVTIEAVITGVMDEFPKLRAHKRLITFLTCVVLFLLSVICNTEGSLHVISLLDTHCAIAAVPVVCLLELIASVYMYGPAKLSLDVRLMTGRPLRPFWFILWRYIVPIILVVMTIYAMRGVTGLAGWCIAMVSVICIPIYAIKMLYQSKGPLMQRIRENSRPNKEWGPSDSDARQRWLAAREHEKAKRRAISDVECFGHEQAV